MQVEEQSLWWIGSFFLSGAAHADDISLIFKQNKTGIAEEDFAFGDEIITRWINFVYSGYVEISLDYCTSI